MFPVKTCSNCGFYKILPCPACTFAAEERAAKSREVTSKFEEFEPEIEAIGA